jgi:ring-1,2-phenylacetyl-CoA epoxidase subunit PaaC
VTETWPRVEIDPDVAAVVLALADDELVIGHRHSEWLGLSPFLEEDLAMASIAQDELGHARALYGVVWPSWNERDARVPLRPPLDWRCRALVELDARPWERHLVRHVFYDVIEEHRWQALTELGIDTLTAVAARAMAEERWHRRHGVDLLQRLASAGGARLQEQVDHLFSLLGALTDGLSAKQRADAMADLIGVIVDAGLVAPADAAVESHDRTQRSAAFSDVHQSFIEVASIDAAATW